MLNYLNKMKAPITWYLVADTKSARMYNKVVIKNIVPVARSRKSQTLDVYKTELKLISGMEFQAESKDDFEIRDNKMGKVFGSSSSAHHMGIPHVSIEDEIRNNFAALIAKLLNESKAKNLFDKLVIAAPAKMLGSIKKELNKVTVNSIILKVPKNLMHLKEDALGKHLTELPEKLVTKRRKPI